VQAQAEHAVLMTAYSESRKSWLLASIGPDCLAIIDNLCGARTPEDCTVLELEQMLKTYFRPARNKMTERDKFNSRIHLPSESVAEYAVVLGQLAKTCDFGTYLDEALQTQFINNIVSSRIKEKMEEGAATFQALVGKSASYELKQTHSPESSPAAAVNFVNKRQNKKPVKVARNRQEGTPKTKNVRDFSKVRCFTCNQYGHIAQFCRKPARKNQDVRYVEPGSQPIELYHLEDPKRFPKRLMIYVTINGIPIDMEVDTGAFRVFR
jgi:hypothetical protein